MEIVNKKDHEHFFRELHQHINDANTHSTQPKALHHIDHAKNIVKVLAEDLGIELTNKGD